MDLNIGDRRVTSTWYVCYLNMFTIKMYNRFSRMSLLFYIQWEQHDLYSLAILLFSLRVCLKLNPKSFLVVVSGDPTTSQPTAVYQTVADDW